MVYFLKIWHFGYISIL